MTVWNGPAIPNPHALRLMAREEIVKIMLHAIRLRASDVIFQTGRPVLASIYGELTALTSTWLQPRTMERICTVLSSMDSIVSKLYSGTDFDAAIHIDDPEEADAAGEPKKQRFRINMTPNHYEGEVGLQVVCRHIPADPPSTAELGVEPEIVAASTPARGALIIAGYPGSGKTTTFASLIRRILEEDTPIRGNLLTYEEPIEYVFDGIRSRTCTISQHEIGRHVASFSAGIRNSLRRTPGLSVVGELRDAESIQAAVEFANIGRPLFTTTHANSVANVIRRMCLKFPTDHQVAAFHDIVSMTHMIVSQLLVPRSGGGLYCLREWQVITESIRHELIDAGLERSVDTMRSVIERGTNGRSMGVTVRDACSSGFIDAKAAQRVLEQYDYNETQVTLRDAAA